MKFFIDTANIEEIKEAHAMGMVDGVTTNPSLIAKEGRDFKEIIKEICSIVDGPISAEVISLDTDGMVTEARDLAQIHDNIVVKIPMTIEGLKAVRILSSEGIKTNVTLVFSPLQALMAAKAGATFVSPFIGRLDDLSQEGMVLVEQIVEMYSNYAYDTEIIVASVRNAFSWKLLQEALAGTMTTVGTIIWLILGAVSFVGIYNLIGGSDFMRSLITGLGLPPLGIILVMMLVLMVLGTFMEWIAIVFITVPVFAPVVVALAPELGLDPSWAAIWFGVLFVMNIQIYFLSPPFGPACFWLKSVAPKDVTLQEIFIAVLPFIVLQIIGMLLVMFIPEIALWLPETMNKK